MFTEAAEFVFYIQVAYFQPEVLSLIFISNQAICKTIIYTNGVIYQYQRGFKEVVMRTMN